MSIPPVIPIAYEPENRTEHIGRHSSGLFLGTLVGPRRDQPHADESSALFGQDFDFFAVLHLFDHDGTHLRTRLWSAAVLPRGADVIEDTENILKLWLAKLSDVERCSIEVAPFRVTSNGIEFGLIPRSHVRGASLYERVELVPDGLVFYPPWDGLYDT